MRLHLFFCPFLFLLCLDSFAEVFIDPSIRPCSNEIARKWQYTPTPVEAPGTPKMTFHCDGDVKVFEITAEPVMSVFDNSYEPGPIYTWGYNGNNPGPVMEILEGEKVRVHFKNKLPEPTSIHWHGLDVPYQQDGVPGYSQAPVKPGESFTYEWSVNQSGTFMYHAHMDAAKQLSMGLVGFLIIHPKKVPETLVNRDILYFLQMWALPPHTIFPDVMEMMMFNYFTMNGKSAPYIPPTTVNVGEKVRLRFANMSMMEHPMHLHGLTWRVVATGSGDNPRSTHTYGNTILVPTAQTMDVIIDDVKNPGEWMLHCHLPHHLTNNMDVDTIPGEPMNMGSGGMHTVFKVYRGPNDPGYENSSSGHENDGNGGGHDSHGKIAPKITIYDGQLKLSNGTRFDITLELYKAQENKEWRKARAFVKVYFNKDEFIVFTYDQVKYNFETGKMSLESDQKSLSLTNLSYMDHGQMGMLNGEATIDFGAISGTVSLQTRDNGSTDINLRNELGLTGEYEANCKGKTQYLQLISARSLNARENEDFNPMGGFGLYGTIGTKEVFGNQVSSSITEGFYNPFRGNLRLTLDTAGSQSTLICESTVKNNKLSELNCDNGCQYLKKASPVLAYSSKSVAPLFVKDDTPKITELTEDKVLTGLYKGALVLARNNEVLPLNLKIVAKRYATNAMILTKNYISGSADLFTGGTIPMSFKLKDRIFLDSSSKINQGKNLLMLESSAGLSLVINRWTKRSISGDAYHVEYGYLGSFMVLKNLNQLKDVLTNLEDIKFVSQLDGTYSGSDWKLELFSAEVEDGKGPGFYSPLHIKGRLINKSGAMSINFVSGSYDFPLGTFYLKTDDNRIFKGSVSDDDLELLLISKPIRRSNYLQMMNTTIQMKRILP